MTNKRIQSERWLTLLKKVLEHCETDTTLAPGTNHETFSRAMTWLDKLMNGEALSPKQAQNFLDSIRKRVPGKSRFEWSGPIALTQKQIDDEKRFDRLDRFRSVNRKKTFAANLMTEAVSEKLDELDFTDVEVLAAFKAHILAFSMPQEEDQSVEEATEPFSENLTEAHLVGNQWSISGKSVVNQWDFSSTSVGLQ